MSELITTGDTASAARRKAISDDTVAEVRRHMRARGSLPVQIARHAREIVVADGSNGSLPPLALIIMGTAGVTAAAISLTAALIILLVSAILLPVGVLTAATLRATAEPGALKTIHERGLERARHLTTTHLDRMIGNADPELTVFHGVNALMRDEDAREIADDLAVRMEDLHSAWERARVDSGRSDTAAIDAGAQEAALALAEGSMAAHADLVARMKAGDDVNAPDVARRFLETARAVTGMRSQPTALPPPSAAAALQRLIGLSEQALAVDPDLADDSGARLDDLVRVHLPRLLETHAAAARAGDPADLPAIDATLAEGVEQIRASVDEALDHDARKRFEALRTEVAFLRARRGVALY